MPETGNTHLIFVQVTSSSLTTTTAIPTYLCLENPVHQASGCLIIASVMLPVDKAGQTPLQNAVEDGRHEGYDEIEHLFEKETKFSSPQEIPFCVDIALRIRNGRAINLICLLSSDS